MAVGMFLIVLFSCTSRIMAMLFGAPLLVWYGSWCTTSCVSPRPRGLVMKSCWRMTSSRMARKLGSAARSSCGAAASSLATCCATTGSTTTWLKSRAPGPAKPVCWR